jgi:hypothetical protein
VSRHQLSLELLSPGHLPYETSSKTGCGDPQRPQCRSQDLSLPALPLSWPLSPLQSPLVAEAQLQSVRLKPPEQFWHGEGLLS